MDRETLSELGMELAPTARENSYIQKFYLYLNLTKPSAKLYLSYGRMGLDGRVLRPSYVVGSILRMFPQLTLQDEDLIEDPLARITTAESGIVHLADGLRKAALGSVEKTAASLFGWYEGQENIRIWRKSCWMRPFCMERRSRCQRRRQNGFTDRRWSTVSAGWRNFRRAPMHIF